jgi:AraC-type DNA-binding domain-containing proteins
MSKVKIEIENLLLSPEGGLFYKLVERLPYPMQVYLPDGTLLIANPAFLREFKIPSASLVEGRYNILKDETLAGYGVREKVVEAFTKGEPDTMAGIPAPVHAIKKWFHLPVSDAELYYLDVSSAPVKDGEGKLLYVVLIFVPRKKLVDSREEISRAKEYIEAHWREEFSAEDIASIAGMSSQHLARLFKSSAGQTPHDYYVKIKIDKLKETLLDGNRSVEQAFSDCGIVYHGYYAKLFKKMTGTLPSEYKKSAEKTKDKIDL